MCVGGVVLFTDLMGVPNNLNLLRVITQRAKMIKPSPGKCVYPGIKIEKCRSFPNPLIREDLPDVEDMIRVKGRNLRHTMR